MKKYNNRGRWTDDELDGLYNLAIIQRRSVEELITLSNRGRTGRAITTKLYKTFRTAIRLSDDGLHYLYLPTEVDSKIIRRRKKAMLQNNNTEEPTSNENTSSNTIIPDEDKRATIADMVILQNKMLRRNYNLQNMIEENNYLIELYEDIINERLQAGVDDE